MSYPTLQIALYYIILIKEHVPEVGIDFENHNDADLLCPLRCGRRMFLSALILASKVLQDRNYSVRGWRKISGLDIKEINRIELAFLIAIDWKLYCSIDMFQRWSETVLNLLASGLFQDNPECKSELKRVILRIKPDLSNSWIEQYRRQYNGDTLPLLGDIKTHCSGRIREELCRTPVPSGSRTKSH